MCVIYLLDIEDLIINNYSSVINKQRKEYICSIKNKGRKKQSFFVWKLLEFALKNIGVRNPSFENNNGKWSLVNGEVKFSLSHSRNMVAVAIDDNNVGVDIELISDKLLPLEKRYNTNLMDFDKLLYLSRCFTEEEAKFKAEMDINTKSYIVEDKKGNKYSLSVCTDSDVEIIKVENIE